MKLCRMFVLLERQFCKQLRCRFLAVLMVSFSRHDRPWEMKLYFWWMFCRFLGELC